MKFKNGTKLSRLDAAVLDSIPEPVVVIDNQRDVVVANRSAKSDIGVTYPGRTLALSLRHPAALEAVDQVLAGDTARTVEVTFPAPSPRTFDLIVAPVPGDALEQGSPTKPGAVLVFHDITAEKMADQMRADFVANVSHELRSPLSALVGFIETLQGPAQGDKEAQKKFFGIMAVEAGRMKRLIEDLLSLSAIEVEEHVPPRDRVRVVELIEGVGESMGQLAAAKDMKIVIDAATDLPKVLGDSDLLAQVIRNLVENAIFYGRTSTQVTITVRPLQRLEETGEPGVSVSVTDSGEGIAREHLPRLTERFYRADTARSRQLGGTGLGLAIVKHIINRHRGRLTIDSELGKGSVFTITLPTADPKA
jgi:two-component system phosphate regulon sensor histidine kinase PhoR